MTARWLRTVEASGEPGRVSLQELEGDGEAAIICREIIMEAAVGQHIDVELVRVASGVLRRQREETKG